MPKNIVVFCDGTGQDGGMGINTNVYKFYNMIEDRTPRQISFYDPGLGTGVQKLTGLAFGRGISKNIKQCYRFIFDNYEAGDRLFLFGFSRGATTVRSLSSFIHYFGILPKARPELIDRAYKIYKLGEKKRIRLSKDFVERHHTMWTRIRFLGVWDTVAALGLPSKFLDLLVDKLPGWSHRFHNLRLSEGVDNAYHALAVDDERQTFHPAIWDPHIREPRKGWPKQILRQVWFSGMHTDVGGGYEAQGLSDLSLEWMGVKAEKHGLIFHQGHQVLTNPDPNGLMADSRGGVFGRFYRKKRRSWPPGRADVPVVYRSVKQRTKNCHNSAEPPYNPWILEGKLRPEVEPRVRWKKGLKALRRRA